MSTPKIKMIVENLHGEQWRVVDYKNIERYREVNVAFNLSFMLLKTDKNAHSYDYVDNENTIIYDGVKYVIKRIATKMIGKKPVKIVHCELKAYNELMDEWQYTNISGSRAINEVMAHALKNTGYSYNVIGVFNNETFQDFGENNSLALMSEIMEKYNAEFFIIDKTIFVYNEIGSDTNSQFRYRHNIGGIELDSDTESFSTYIKGFGADGLEVEYESELVEMFGRRHAPPVSDEGFTNEESLLKECKKRLDDQFRISIEIDYVEIQKNGKNINAFDLGDRLHLIHGELDIKSKVRVLAITDYPESGKKPRLKIANITRDARNMLADFNNTKRTVDKILDGEQKLPYNVLDDAVKIATEALQSAQTELEFKNGIIARDKNNPNLLVLFNSAGVGVSTDGGQTFNTAMTGAGIVADMITAGYMSFNRARGGTLQLGGYENVNGVMQVFNSDGDVIADLDGDRGGFSSLYIGDLTASHVEAPNVVQYRSSGFNIYINTSGDDNNEGGSSSPLRTFAEAMRRVPKYSDGTVTIILQSNFNEAFRINGYTGDNWIRINFNGYENTQFISIASNTKPLLIYGGKINRNAGSALIFSARNSFVQIQDLELNGNGQENGISSDQNDNIYLNRVEIYNVTHCVENDRMSNLLIRSGAGLADVSGVRSSNGSYVRTISSTYEGGSHAINLNSASQHHGTTTTDTGTATPPADPVVEVTEEWSATSSRSWRDNWSWRTDNNEVYQGEWSGYGLHKGLWFFGDSVRNAVNGKTIKRIRVHVSRKSSGGNSGNVGIVFRSHNHASQPSGEPTLSSTTHTVNFSWGESKWVTLPSAFHSIFENGNARGIGIYTTSRNNSDYAIFNPSARIEITYE